ncbi:MAG: tRNA (cytidine(34)-2'-O)-methyltransferase [Chthoniobacterales bacterium]|nr:tRNA (cytidine(34)-2'-O)-methyltransferase [Chthoniobacterales bacterium]
MGGGGGRGELSAGLVVEWGSRPRVGCGLHVVLVEPEIPPNTGNIARLCLASGAQLHLIEPLGFSLDDRALRRAGMDYWEECRVKVWPSWQGWVEAHPGVRFWLFTTKGSVAHWDAPFRVGDALVFGRETRGLPQWLLDANREWLLRIPMVEGARSLNLATAVGIALYEAWRVCLATEKERV